MTKFNTLSIVNIQQARYRRELLQLNTDICEKPIGLPRWLSGKESTYNAGAAGDAGSVPGLGRPPDREHGHPLQYSCLEKSTDRGAWQATVHGVANSWT